MKGLNKREFILFQIFCLIAIILAVIFIKWTNSRDSKIGLITAEDLHNAQFTTETVTEPSPSQNVQSFEHLKYSFIEDIEVPEELQPKEALLVKNVEMTFYLPTGNTCSNMQMPQENHTVAFERSYRDCECDIYTLDGELIGHYFIDDTGYGRTEENGQGTIQNANCVDVFFENETDGREFIAKWGNEVQIVIYEKEE